VQDAIKKLAEIQQALSAPKGQRNDFSNFNYRSCESILQAVKPLMGGALILLTDDIKVIADRVYVEATAEFHYENQVVKTKAFARENLIKKGMDEAQITGSTSSYARKYALNGLLMIDDNKDSDSQDNREEKKLPPVLTDNDKTWITNVKADHSVLETITDPTYKAMIKKESGI